MPYILQITDFINDDNSGLPYVKIAVYKNKLALEKRAVGELTERGISDNMKAAIADLLTYGYYPLSDGYIAIKELDYQVDMSVFNTRNRYVVENRVKERTMIKKYPIGKIIVECSIRLKDSGALLGGEDTRNFFKTMFAQRSGYEFSGYHVIRGKKSGFNLAIEGNAEGATYVDWRKLIMQLLNDEQRKYKNVIELDVTYVDVDVDIATDVGTDTE